jgi:Fic family protein
MALAVEAAAFKSSKPAELVSELGELVRSMNCYYSNLIEGHHTHPIDIERALSGTYDNAPEKRNLQLEARAHIEVQQLIDREQSPTPVTSEEFIRWVHRDFCERLPAELLIVSNPTTGERRTVVPGAYRQHHVEVGRHIAPSPDDVPTLMAQFVGAFDGANRTAAERIVLVASAHHRLLWIHPFLDGNGRVARLLSHAMLRACGVGSELWSLPRGLAREVAAYKEHLAAADEPRRGDLDGRGNLSDQALADFCRFFLTVCLDQVRFMRGLLDTDGLQNRIRVWAKEEIGEGRLPAGTDLLLAHAAAVGAVARGDAGRITGYQKRQARTVLSALLVRGLFKSDGPRAPVRLAFPAAVAERWLPLLYSPSTLAS